ncbi:MAG: toxin-antitoxin (TA) system antitoxin [Chthonomonadetes bacterium]|nr:toxin-antitoxin (TA) system antitoxin [Chthonomonadetes bacterium]
METPTKTFDLQEAKDRFMELMSLIASGVEIILTESDVPVARLVPVTPTSSPRVAGLHAGAISTSEDFDEPLPETIWTGNA